MILACKAVVIEGIECRFSDIRNDRSSEPAGNGAPWSHDDLGQNHSKLHTAGLILNSLAVCQCERMTRWPFERASAASLSSECGGSTIALRSIDLLFIFSPPPPLRPRLRCKKNSCFFDCVVSKNKCCLNRELCYWEQGLCCDWEKYIENDPGYQNLICL